MGLALLVHAGVVEGAAAGGHLQDLVDVVGVAWVASAGELQEGCLQVQHVLEVAGIGMLNQSVDILFKQFVKVDFLLDFLCDLSGT